MAEAKPIKVHALALFVGVVLLAGSLAFSWAVPFVFVTAMRDGERVDCVVEQRLLGLISFKTTTIDDLKSVRLEFEPGSGFGRVKSTESYDLTLTDVEGNVVSVMLETGKSMGRGRSTAFVKTIDDFIGSNESHVSTWTVPWLGYGPILPAALGMLVVGLVTSDFIRTQLARLK